MRSKAFWIAPDGVVHAVADTHMSYLMEHAPLFGFDETEAAMWSEDDRDHVLPRAFARGWIRVRLYADGWHFQTSRFGDDPLTRILHFLEGNGAWESEQVRILDEGGKVVFTGPLADLRSRADLNCTGKELPT